jgi:hypothetical protein
MRLGRASTAATTAAIATARRQQGDACYCGGHDQRLPPPNAAGSFFHQSAT